MKRGFTLIELLVVVFIIVVLLGLLVAGMSGAFGAANVGRAQGDMQKMLAAHQEYRAQTGQYVTFDTSPSSAEESISHFIEKLISVPESKKLILSVSKDSWVKDGGTYPSGAPVGDVLPRYFKDPWGTPYQYRSRWNGGGGLPSRGAFDNPATQKNETHLQPFIASAGPDEEWGIYIPASNQAKDEEKEDVKKNIDNIYSFEFD